ncbi:MAG: hypothetical protein BV456_03145 [Thermoplasmata archaeon M8B2D]|nr:MAG: hypothetical protein BV456_03145 [Thermoplasmata archaeon M8B2D]
MSIARVILTGKGPATHLYNGRKFIKGQPQTITSQREINYYKTEYGFSVTYLSGKEHDEETVVDEEVNDKKNYTKDELKDMKKTTVLNIARGLNIPVLGTEKKKQIIDSILLSQESDEDE